MCLTSVHKDTFMNSFYVEHEPIMGVWAEPPEGVQRQSPRWVVWSKAP